MAVEQSALVAAWYRGSLWLALLRPLEFLFRGLTLLRRALYRGGFKSTWKSPKPVVVVGNITVGGTGKTPIVIALVEYLQANGIKPGVVSRGYGATHSIFPHTVGAQSRAADCGDEPLLIFRRTGCPCVVAPDRVLAVKQLLANFDIDIVLCDDGLQHYALVRDLEIAVLDEERRMGNGWCLPAGPLREPAKRLKEVDYVLYRGSEDVEKGVAYTAEALINLSSGESVAISPEQLGEEVYAVAGIGQPSQFFQSLERRGFRVTEHAFSDHHKFVAADFAQLLGKPIIMTEKDAVKCRELVDTQAWYVKISARLPRAVKLAVLELAKHEQPNH